MSGPTLLTPRLLLRLPEAGDFEPWAAFAADAETMRFLGGAMSRTEAWRNICTVAGAWSIRGFGMFSVIERASGRWIGRIGPWQPVGWPGTEIGWGLARAFCGQGYALEAARATMDYAVDVLGWRHIIHTIDPDNAASIRLAERLGSRHEGPTRMPAPFADRRIDLWGQSAAAWRSARAAQAATDSSVG
ncbi:GNAT family N-acetyltransferase [Sphingomonas quercus]|uniref:GNAT family N-acetyltransferase n=1 Tax=Sphingomonas quercus TaxID=2842451 RepID=A0ABS6BFD3_9SPHN|nr:GNAT family N-acetyltransferase [Sphingomonas quercus]MBU3077009.1 GNAT family N-acetyltransferase [Sphingomonas quercus]